MKRFRFNKTGKKVRAFLIWYWPLLLIVTGIYIFAYTLGAYIARDLDPTNWRVFGNPAGYIALACLLVFTYGEFRDFE
jgi:hypothetical protein